jgi:ATP-dependent RNA helicase DeaD
MSAPDLDELVGPALAAAMREQGFTTLTKVQLAVLDPTLEDSDLRITSQTGSGKTVAIGLALRDVDVDAPAGPKGAARPHAIVLAPTRELAKQVEKELAWLFATRGGRVASVTGGGGYRDELRSFKAGPAVVVGTPGRLADHLARKTIDPSEVQAVVLDEADRMLDLGFREDLETILEQMPEERRVHLVSATFPREVKALADRFQKSPTMVQGTPLGAANADIDHVVHLVHDRERFDAIVNLLLEARGASTLIFAETRADVAALGQSLADAGFVVATLSGEMEQAERNRALAAFRRGSLDAMVATDVAARGIDVADITRVVHADPPKEPDSYTHRSGRTGRAGKKGTSSVLVTPPSFVRTLRTLERAKVKFRIAPVPSADEIRAAQDAVLFDELTAADAESAPSPRDLALAKRLAERDDVTTVIARLLARSRGTLAAPRRLKPITPPATRRGIAGPREPRADGPRERRTDGPRPRRTATREGASEGYAPFHVSWGQVHGADARRLLALVCRRTGIRGSDVGAIHVFPTYSVVEVREDVSNDVAKKGGKPDPRDPRITIRPWTSGGRAARPRG